VSKKQLILIVMAGLISFGGSFVFGWMTTEPEAATAQDYPDFQDVPESLDRDAHMEPEQFGEPVVGQVEGRMSERQVEDLIYDLRRKIEEYEQKMERLDTEKRRFDVTKESMREDIEYLDDLRVELASSVADLRRQRDELEKSRIRVSEKERENLRAIAQSYDRMDAQSAASIFINMAQMRETSPQIGQESFEDVLKILHYMTDRTKAQVLAQIVDKEPQLAAVLSSKLKRIEEE